MEHNHRKWPVCKFVDDLPIKHHFHGGFPHVFDSYVSQCLGRIIPISSSPIWSLVSAWNFGTETSRGFGHEKPRMIHLWMEGAIGSRAMNHITYFALGASQGATNWVSQPRPIVIELTQRYFGTSTRHKYVQKISEAYFNTTPISSQFLQKTGYSGYSTLNPTILRF